MASLLEMVLSDDIPPSVKLKDIFRIEREENGSCTDEQVKVIEEWLSDCQILIKSAIDCVTNAETDQESLMYLTTFFGITSFDDIDPVKASVEETSDYILTDLFQEEEEGKPWLFCNSDWIEEQTWSSLLIDPETNEPNKDGILVQDRYETYKKEVPFWAPKFKQYLRTDPKDYCSNPEHYGATQNMIEPGSITLCVENIRKKWAKPTLADLDLVSRNRVQIKDLQPQSLTLFHEFFHLALGPESTPDHSYEIDVLVQFETEKAYVNPESYTLWALAYYLGQKNPRYTFASTSSARKR